MDETAPKENKQKTAQPTVLVAGGAGFLGANLCSTLLTQNFKVVCVDNLSTGKKDNLKEFLTNPNFTFIEADINSPDFQVPEEIKTDYVFDLASIEEYGNQKNLSLDSLLVNSLGARALLETARKAGAKFILVSSADIYSGAISSSSLRYYFGKSPTEEAILSTHEAKRFSEALAFEYFRNFDLDVRIVRIKDVYGPKMNLERGDPLSKMLSAVLTQKPLVVQGDGLDIVNPTYVTDVVFALIKAAVGSFKGEIFILVNPEKVTTESLAQTIKLVAGSVEIEHKKEKEESPFPLPPINLDNSKEKLGFSPKVNLAEGVSAFIHFYRFEIKTPQPSFEKLQFNEPISLTGEEGASQIKTKPEAKKGNWFRLAVFILSALLLLITVVYPLGGVAVKGYLGRSEMENAMGGLEQNNPDQAAASAQKAESTFQSAQNDLQNVTWLLKMVGFATQSANLDHLFSASESLSSSINSSAQVTQTLVDTASSNSLTQTTATEKLNQSLTLLNNAKDKLEEVKLTTATIDWSKIPSWFAPDQKFMRDEPDHLEGEVDSLIATINSVLAKNKT